MNPFGDGSAPPSGYSAVRDAPGVVQPPAACSDQDRCLLDIDKGCQGFTAGICRVSVTYLCIRWGDIFEASRFGVEDSHAHRGPIDRAVEGLGVGDVSVDCPRLVPNRGILFDPKSDRNG